MREIKEGIVTGVVLIVLGVAGYFLGGSQSYTAFIPSVFGLLILIGSLIATKNLKLGMHMAAVFGLLGFLAPLGRLIPTAAKGSLTLDLATISQVLMIIICGIFVWLCVLSFKRARKQRAAS